MKTDFEKQGKQNRKKGKAFELTVRKDLESKGWIVSKWCNNVKFRDAEYHGKIPNFFGELIPAKPQYNPFLKRIQGEGSGFPDFIALTRIDSNATWPIQNEDGTFYLSGIRCWIGVEVKSNGYLTKEEKEKCKWLLDKKVFSRILIAKKSESGGIEYKEFNPKV